MRKQLPKEALLELAYQGEYYESGYELEVVRTRVLDKSRWSIFHEMIIHDVTTGRYYSTGYSEGATEAQDESPYEDEPEMVYVTEVFEVKQIVSWFVSDRDDFAQTRSSMLGEIERLISGKDEMERIGELDELFVDMEKIQYFAEESHRLNRELLEVRNEEGEE